MIRVRQIKIEVNKKDTLTLALATKMKVKESDILSYNIVKESIDARNKNHILYIYEIDANVKDKNKVLKKNKSQDIFKAPEELFQFPINENLEQKKVVIVGSGPAGLFAAYMLAKNNFKPIIIERGKKTDERVKDVEKFFLNGILNPESNVQFGEGGAGTFSDGKLHTLVKDKLGYMKEVLKIFVSCGAPQEILYCYKPHIGTDLLRTVITNMREKIISMGGIFYYNTKLTDIYVKNNKLISIEVNHKDNLKCDHLILAIGNSARDTYRMLYKNKINMESKPFAIGIRIQHPQKMIDESQYGVKYKNILNKASYKLTYTTKQKRGVYSFCMCPGGYVINASSTLGELAINGMSNYDRESENANSAIVVTVNKDDFGLNVLDGIKYQEEIEKKAYKICQGKIPIQLYQDFRENRLSFSLKEVNPVFKGSYSFANINDILPRYIIDSIKEAMIDFDKKIKGFAQDNAIIAGVETRTSSPVRIVRDENLESNIKGIYPCGEGAGYAGGITSSAMDGIKVANIVALKIVNKLI